jgi:hypothetical protein
MIKPNTVVIVIDAARAANLSSLDRQVWDWCAG